MEKVSTVGLDISPGTLASPESCVVTTRWFLQGVAAVPDLNGGLRDRLPLDSVISRC